ncbi:MAG: flagellar basal-body rod protein FlgB [Alphaproteobacteria bacterium 64-11]|nr:flagellar basal body rod protein FlgB [Alphaproteobacteria bacterium]OJU12851.1 MAG: flagellar basal-body rod protein FlgB [Alphaproteobacteria bacterium 64-11]
MNLPDIPLMSMLRERMSWLNRRQDVLSQNVANADTPGYIARDLKPQDFDAMMRSSQVAGRLATTNARHIAISTSRTSVEEEQSPSQEYTHNGTAVSLEEEMIKVADTQAQFQAAANLYSKAMMLMRTAIGH